MLKLFAMFPITDHLYQNIVLGKYADIEHDIYCDMYGFVCSGNIP